MQDTHILDVVQKGCCLLRQVMAYEQTVRWIEAIEVALASASASVLRSQGEVYGARNLLSVFPEAAQLAQLPEIRELATALLGQDCAVVRGLYFDKPPTRSWSLPWHRDRTISVREHSASCGEYSNPNTKAGVPHYIAPVSLLEQMVTFRFHLDAMTTENGPVVVIDGSHIGVPTADDDIAEFGSQEMRTIFCDAGDVFVMRPLLVHCSMHSQAGTGQHRRVIHLECAPAGALSKALQWYDCHPLVPDRLGI